MARMSATLSTAERQSLQRYLDALGSEVLLTAEQEAELSERCLAGDEQAINQLTRANLRFVVSVAQQYVGKGIGLQDLINEGNIGLMSAARRYDARKGQRFVQYVVWKVRQAIERALRQVEPSMPASLDAPLRTGSHTTLHDVVGDNDNGVWQGDSEEIKACLRMLNEREAKVVTLFYGVDGERMTYAEIAMHMHLKRERVRQILKKALRKVRNNSRLSTITTS